MQDPGRCGPAGLGDLGVQRPQRPGHLGIGAELHLFAVLVPEAPDAPGTGFQKRVPGLGVNRPGFTGDL